MQNKKSQAEPAAADEVLAPLPDWAAQWLWPIGPYLQMPSEWLLTPRQVFTFAADRWPLRDIAWLSANSQIKGIEYTNTMGRRVQRLWRDLHRND
jgi:mannose/cellobiose epimerase-like protein (N-acyl-D-glucosamine 2-epimerase family)